MTIINDTIINAGNLLLLERPSLTGPSVSEPMGWEGAVCYFMAEGP
jgi:hypothetical protein